MRDLLEAIEAELIASVSPVIRHLAG